MKIAFRVDSSPVMGAGHFMRCFSLAKELQHQRHECVFISKTLIEQHQQKLESAFLEFFQVSQIDSDTGSATCEILTNEKIDAIVVDHYQLDETWEAAVRKHCSNILVIDDLCRSHDRGVNILDPTLGRIAESYSRSEPDRVMCGADYALLGEQYYPLREQLLGETEPSKKSLLVCFGGGQASQLTLQTLKALKTGSIEKFDDIIVVLPQQNATTQSVKDLCIEMGADLHSWIEDMAVLLAHTTHAIGSPGGMSWERCALGIPSILIQIAENQRDNLDALEKAGAVLRCHKDQLSDDLPKLLSTLDENYAQMKENALLVADGLGTRRVAQLFDAKRPEVFLRKAKAADIKTVFDWQNESGARRFALNTKVPDWAEHSSWMENKVQSPDAHFHMIEFGGNAAGFLRLDKEGTGQYRVSIMISQNFQKRGIASIALERAAHIHRESTLLATVLPQNSASVALFTNAGYAKQSQNEYVLKAGR